MRPELQRGDRSRFLAGLRDGSYNGNLEAATAVRLVSLLRYATGVLPLEGYELESGKIGTPSALISDLVDALNAAIDQLTRPVDAIKHQAKTVTVGISRSEDALFGVASGPGPPWPIGAAPDTLGYRALRTLGALDAAVAEVAGFTRYRIDWPPAGGPTIAVVDQGGIGPALHLADGVDPRLRGTKHRAADEREVTVARGASDGRTVILVPEVKGTPGDRDDAAARAVPRAVAVGGGQAGAVRLPQPLLRPGGRGDRDRALLRRRAARDGAPRRSAHRAGVRAGEALAPSSRAPCTAPCSGSGSTPSKSPASAGSGPSAGARRTPVHSR